MNINVSRVIEQEPFGRLQLLVLVLISAAVIVDGFDIQMIAFVSPVLIEEWGITRGDLAPAVSAALAGMIVGAPVGGWLGDRFGRRLAAVFSTFFFGITTFPVAFADNITQLTLFRFITGLGFGALLPNATAMIAEWMPTRIRSYAISLMIIGIPVGGMIGAASSSLLIAAVGWQACFIAGGVLGLLLSGLLFFTLPESPKFLTMNSEAGRAVVPLLNRAFGQGRFQESAVYESGEGPKGTWSDIFSPKHFRVTVGIGIAFFASLLVFYGFANWIPTILTTLGMPLNTALQGAMLFNLWGLAGAVGVAALVSKVGSRLGLFLVLGAAALATIGVIFAITAVNTQVVAVFVALSAAGALLAGLQVGLYTLAAGAYPTDCRSTGVGFAAGIGRLGPIVSAYAGGLLLDLTNGNVLFFTAIILALVVAALGVFFVNRHTPAAKTVQEVPAITA
jgi:AAHS family 4-hydroxybenzoate transporter-like MFS transporter